MEELIHKMVTASYRMLDVTDGTEILLEETTEDKPLTLMTDMGMMPIIALENVLKEKSTGESFEVILQPSEAFGEYVQERVVELDKQIFCVNGEFDQVHIREGVIVPLQNEDGQRFMGQVTKITDDKVTIDLNHPLAGKTLKFCGNVIESHTATEEEVMALLNQMNHHGCGGCSGGGCGSCEGNCGEGGCGNCNH